MSCICGKASTMEMIACEGEECEIIWWHYNCAGFAVNTIPGPLESWICDRCRPGTSAGSVNTEESFPSASLHITAEPAAAARTSTEEPAAASTCTDEPAAAAPTTKKTPKSRSRKATKKVSRRPEAIFDGELAKEQASKYFKTSLQQMKTHPVFRARYPAALCVMALVMQLMELLDSQEFEVFCQDTVAALWIVVTAGDTKHLKPEGYEIMWRSFHTYRLSSIANWKRFLHSVHLDDNGQHVYLLYQYLLQAVLDLLIKDRNNTDKPEQSVKQQPKPITTEEEQVLRYVAGYVPFSLHKKFSKQANETARTYCKFLKTWKTCTSDTAKTFLEYTNEWIEAQNRGGLFHVSDGVYLLFRSIEFVTREYLTTSNIESFPGLDVQTELFDKIVADQKVQRYWCSLTQGKITGENSTKLLGIIAKQWIKIRTKAFINVYLNLRKASGSGVSKKAEKALRKDLSV